MKLTFKNLQQQTFKMDIEPEMTVKTLKEQIAKEKGEESYPVANQKLIYSGKILADEDTIQKYGIDEKKFIVVMVTKARPIPPKTPATPSVEKNDGTETELKKALETTSKSNDVVTQKKEDATEKAEDKPTEKVQAAKEETKDGSSSKNEAGPGMVVGEEYEKMVQNIVDMGYERSKAVAALKASFNNAERAIEYLVSGMPTMGEMEDSLPNVASHPHTEAASSPSTTPPLFPSSTPAEQTTTPETAGTDPLEFLRSQEMFTQMKTLLQRDPSMLPAVLQQLGQSNPQLLQLISQNQESFIRMINEPVGGATPTGRPNPGNPATAGPRAIQVSREEKEAIERLKALGFAEHLVVQAYFACEKNEELAANFLLSQDFED